MITRPRACLARLALSAAGASLGLIPSRAQVAPELLDPYVTTATRTPAPVRTVGNAVDVRLSADLLRRQTTSLAQALGGVPGAPLFASGAPGATSSLFLRGANSNQTLFLVDGIRFSDPNTDYNLFLGGACLGACDSLEVSHGPQSTLYGGEAIGGVVSLRSLRGVGPPRSDVVVEAGSYRTVQGAVSAQAGTSEGAYTFSAQGGHTDNERANNAFDSINASLRIDRAFNARVAVGGTLRWFRGIYGDPGDRFTNDPDNESKEDNVLGTIFGDFAHSNVLASLVTLGGQLREFVSTNPTTGGPAQVTTVTNRRGLLDWQTTFSGWAAHRLTGGFTAEKNHTRNDGFGDIDRSQSLLAVFAQDEFSPAENVFLTAGIRSDDFDTFGHATTGKVTAAWLVAQRSLKFRASYGTAFRSPSFLDLYGESAFYVGNPNLRPERARGWDAGADYYLPSNRGSVGVTWFETDYTDLVVYDFAAFPGTVRNVERARTRGVELSASTRWDGSNEFNLAYTYLEAVNRTTGERLLRRPRHSFSFDAVHAFTRTVTTGAGVQYVSDRRDVDAATFLTIAPADYTVVRVHAAWQASPRVAIKARVENALNQRYEPVSGYPALGVGAYGSVTVNF